MSSLVYEKENKKKFLTAAFLRNSKIEYASEFLTHCQLLQDNIFSLFEDITKSGGKEARFFQEDLAS